MAKARIKSSSHIDQEKRLEKARSLDRVNEFSYSGDEDAFVKQIKATFPGISGSELLEKIALFRELKRIRSTGS